MKKYKIKIEYEEEVSADSEEQAIEEFWDRQNYQQHNVDNFIDEITTIEEVFDDELKEIVAEKIEMIKEDGKK